MNKFVSTFIKRIVSCRLQFFCRQEKFDFIFADKLQSSITVRLGRKQVAAFETWSLRKKTLYIRHVATDGSSAGKGYLMLILRKLTDEIKRRDVNEIERIYFCLWKNPSNSNAVQTSAADLAKSRAAIFRKLNMRRVKILPPDAQGNIPVRGMWQRSDW